jgi:hypothetical protein
MNAKVEDGRAGSKVSVAESMLYGGDMNALVIRRLGTAATALDEAVALVCDLLAAVRDADQIEMGKVRPSAAMDERGRSEVAVRLEDVFERVSGVHPDVADVYTAVAVGFAQAERERRTRVKSDGP